MLTIAQLTDRLPQQGRVEWLGIRPDKRIDMQIVQAIDVTPESAIAGDRYRRANGNRQVTLVQAEHLTAIASLLHLPAISPTDLRRNIVVSGINLLALKDHQFRIGSAILVCTGLCHPCSRMEQTFGPGGYNAVRGHGGITATVLTPGRIAVGDAVLQLARQEDVN